jgi:Protein of unknown function (DUF3293)
MTPELRETFRNARYQVHLPAGTVELAVDRQCAPLAAWLDASGYTCAALLTAFNPGGTLRDDAVNAAAQLQLVSTLVNGAYDMMQGIALDPSGSWPPEPSVLVAGMPQADALVIAREFAQAAFLWIEADAIPRLREAGQAAR